MKFSYFQQRNYSSKFLNIILSFLSFENNFSFALKQKHDL